MAGEVCLETAFIGALSRARDEGRELSAERLDYMTDKVPLGHTIPRLLGMTLFERGDFAGALGRFRQARDRVLLGLESRPGDLLLTEKLGKLERDIADVEAALI